MMFGAHDPVNVGIQASDGNTHPSMVSGIRDRLACGLVRLIDWLMRVSDKEE